jgi:hypothetical protein
MTTSKHSPLPVFVIVLLGFASVFGCGRVDDALASTTATRLQDLAHVYLDYAAAKGTGPRSSQELERHLAVVPTFALQSLGAASTPPRNLFISDRDQAPFVVRYGVSITQCARESAPIIAHEQIGRDGTRLAVYADGRVACLNTQESNSTGQNIE